MTIEPIVPVSAIEHHAYCPRQCALIHVDGIWTENAHTVRGRRSHRRVDTAPSRRERGRLVARGIPLYSDTYGLVGRADAVELMDDGSVVPVEYKGGVRHGNAAELQLCAQALCLEEMLGCTIDHGFVWYAGPRRRERVPLGAELRGATIAAIDRIRSVLMEGRLPPPAADQRCGECQLEPVCLPNVVIAPSKVRRFLRERVFDCG